MFTLSTFIELPIATRLEGFHAKTPTGHNYFITFKVSTDKMNEDFMVIDFKKIKKIIHEEMDKYDHSLILKEGDALIDFYKEGYEKRGVPLEKTRLYIWKEAPTAEFMAYLWFRTFKDLFAKNGIELTHLAITVEETSKNSVTYEEDIK